MRYEKENYFRMLAVPLLIIGLAAFGNSQDQKQKVLRHDAAAVVKLVPVRGLTFFAGVNACAFAAGTGAREFVVRNSLKALSSFTRVTPDKDFGEVRSLAFNSLTTKVAYVARDGRKEWVMIDDRKATPEYTLVSFNREGFEWGGPLVFAGYDAAKDVIVVGRL